MWIRLRRLGFGVAVCALLVCNGFAGTAGISFQCQNASSCDPHGAVIVLRSASDKSIVRRVPLNGASLSITESAGSEWDLTVEANGLWTLPQRIVFPANGASTTRTLDVWRTGVLQGQLKLTDPATANVAVKVAIASRPEPRVAPKLPRGTAFDCSTEKTGRWKCVVPAALLDIAIRAEGYAPYHQWDVKVPIAGSTDLGTVKLQKGASLVAWLDPDFVKRVRTPVHALLRYETAPAVSATAMRLAVPVAEGDFTKKGVVQLTPLSPGRYVLEIRAKGHAPDRLPVQLYEGRVTTPRRSIELLPALNVRLLIQPPLGPGGVPWRVELWRKIESGSGTQDAGSGVASRDGVFEATDQVEGPLHVYLQDSRQNILASRDLVIASGTAEYTVRVDVNRVSGTVTIADVPLPAARLLFGGSGGAEKIRAVTDRDGRYSIELPRRGKWIVDVDAPEEAVAATTSITIDGDGADIALPSTEVSGWVRDADGQRLPAARVVLFSNGRATERTSDADGNFRFRGVRPGSIQLRASDPRTHDYSGEVDVSVAENGHVTSIELDLESVRSLEGVVRSAGDVVVGALVHGWAFLGQSGQQKESTTDLRGGFAFEIPRSVNEAVIIVAAPGRTLESYVVRSDQEPVVVELAPRGGTLALRWTPGALPLRFTFNDHFLPSPDVFVWARGQGARIEDGAGEIPNVAPGKYRFCSADRCVEGLLAMGGRLELDTTRQ